MILSDSKPCCMQDYCRSNQPISLKLDVDNGSTNRKNWLTFGGDPTRIRILDHFFPLPSLLQNTGFRIFISIAHTVTGRFTRHLAKWLTPTK